MYVPKAFAVDDPGVAHDIITACGLGVIAAVDGTRPVIGYAPIALDRAKGKFGAVSFHLAKGNRLAEVLAQGADVTISVMAENAYISPDWYVSPDMVPTWNYVAAEIEGRARLLSPEELSRQVDAVSAVHEARLLPKTPWTSAKMSGKKREGMLTMLSGFEVEIERMTAKRKLSQNRNDADHAGVVCGLEARGDEASRAVAKLMKRD
ncbi:MAG TPA: FMN-binding negative transcriptional regulator [Micropepsaceae bacterium]|nr:FMN-binding negative transcriptional regulator [Micropepsaceae bacterium]